MCSGIVCICGEADLITQFLDLDLIKCKSVDTTVFLAVNAAVLSLTHLALYCLSSTDRNSQGPIASHPGTNGPFL